MGKTKQIHTPPTPITNVPACERKEEAGTGCLLPSSITNDSLPKIESVWDVVGADNLREIPVDDIVLKDKKSLMLFTLFLRNEKDKIETLLEIVNSNNYSSTPKAVPPDVIPRIILPLTPQSSFSPSKERKVIKIPHDDIWKLGERLKKEYKDYFQHPDCIYQNFADGVVFNRDYFNAEDQLAELGIKESTYSDYKLDKTYRIVPLNNSPFKKHDFLYQSTSLVDYLCRIDSLIREGFPYRVPNKRQYTGFPIFESSSLKMSFFFKGAPAKSMLLSKVFYSFTDGHNHLFKKYLPTIFLRDKTDKQSDVYGVFAGLPKSSAFQGRYLPLYNSFGPQRIEKAKNVVVCESVEDADALQQYDFKNKNTAYVAFVCDSGSFDQVDFSPLRNKRVEFLISNHSGKSLEEVRNSVKTLYSYLKKQKRFRLEDFFFRERKVLYPSDEQVAFDLSNNRSTLWPIVVEKKEYTEDEFHDLFNEGPYVYITNSADKTKATNPNQGESVRPHPGRPRHQNLTAEKTILRPFIRRGCTTVLTGDPGIGKSRFAIALAAQVAGSNKEFLKDRFWTRCLPPRGEKNGFKVVYWVFDDVDKDDISLQRKFFARGLSKDQEKNLFIEPGRSIRRRDCESLKEELKKYSSRGMQNHPVDFLIIDTLLSFAGSPAKIFSAFEELVRLKDEIPSLAILVIHHNSKEGNPFGGVLATNMPRVMIEMKRDNTDVTDDLEDPITVNIIKHSNEHFGIDIVPFEIKLDNDHFVITNNSDLPQEKIKKLVIYEYKSNRLEQFSSTDIGRLLGVPRHRIENAWNKEVEEEAKALWSKIKLKQKEKAKALNEASSRKKGSSKDDGQPEDDVQHQPQKEKRPSRKASSPHVKTSARQGNRNKR